MRATYTCLLLLVAIGFEDYKNNNPTISRDQARDKLALSSLFFCCFAALSLQQLLLLLLL